MGRRNRISGRRRERLNMPNRELMPLEFERSDVAA